MSELSVDKITDSGGSELLGRRNAIINGNFGVNQRGVSGTVSLSAGDYGHDRWKAGSSGCTYTFSTTEGVTTIDISAGSLIQVIEDVNLVTDTYVLSWEGTAQGKIGAGSYGDSGVTGSVTGGSNLSIEFDTGTVSRVQFERGTKPTPFEHRSYGEELALCQRYYQLLPLSPINAGFQLMRGSSSGGASETVYYFNGPGMRAAPTISQIVGSNVEFAYDSIDGASGSGILRFTQLSTNFGTTLNPYFAGRGVRLRSITDTSGNSIPLTDGKAYSLVNNSGSIVLDADAEL